MGCRGRRPSPAPWKAQVTRVVQVSGSVAGLAFAAALIGFACTDRDKPVDAPSAAQTVQTSLEADACRTEIDRSDPNETPLRVCPGAAGYTLVLRRVDAGRQSVEVVDPEQRRFALDLHEFVTRHMASIEGPAQWRLALREGTLAPTALVLRVRAHEDNADPARVTRTLLWQARIDASSVCVTDVRPADGLAQADWNAWVDSAPKRACAKPLPALIIDGQRVR